jgi:hypothetical protein
MKELNLMSWIYCAKSFFVIECINKNKCDNFFKLTDMSE